MPIPDITPGTEIPSFVRQQNFHAWNRFAAVNDEFVPIHMDDAAGQAAGFPGAIGMGNLACSYFHNVLRDWLGEQGRICRVSVQYRQPNNQGSILTTRGKIVSVSQKPAAHEVQIELWMEDDAGRVLMNGEALLEVTGAEVTGAEVTGVEVTGVEVTSP